MSSLHIVHDFNARIEKVQSSLTQDSSLLVTNALNIRYLCGFTGSSGALVVDRESVILVTDGRYVEQAMSETEAVEIHESRHLYGGVAIVVRTNEVFFEPTQVTVSNFDRLTSVLLGKTLTKSPFDIETFRVIKDASEVAALTQACAVSTSALHELIGTGLVGMTELQIAHRLNALLVYHGADGPAFEAIVAAGPHSAIPHHQPTNRIFAKGDLLKIDFGAMVQGYHSDCTRTFSAGEPTSWQRETHQAVHASQSAAIELVSAGTATADVDHAAREVIDSLGRSDEFLHGLGHGVGLQIHEDPFLSSVDGARLSENMVITIEPGLYVPGIGGVRIEDTLVVTPSGSQILTVFPYELIDIS